MNAIAQVDQPVLERLINEQRPLLGIALVIIGSVLSVVVMPPVSIEDPVLAAFFLPAFVAGAVGKFVGRFVQMYLRVLAGAITFVILFGFMYSSVSLPVALGTAALNGLVCWAVAVRGAPRVAPVAKA